MPSFRGSLLKLRIFINKELAECLVYLSTQTARSDCKKSSFNVKPLATSFRILILMLSAISVFQTDL